MNYREKLLRQQNKNQVAQLEQVIFGLQNSTSAQELNKEKKAREKAQNLLNDMLGLLGSDDIKKLSDLSNLLQGKTLKELVLENNQLKNTDEHKTITNLENKLADQKGELTQVKREKETLLKVQENLTDKIQTANYQIEGLIKNIEKGLVKGEANILTQIRVIESLLKEKK